MKNFTILLLFSFTSLLVQAQTRFNIATGFANYSGDIQQKWVTTKGSRMMISGGISVDVGKHFLLRSDISFANLAANDKNNQHPGLVARNLNFKTSVTELSIMGEYHIFSLENYKLTPYLFAGVAGFRFNPFTSDSAGNKVYLQPLNTEGQGLAAYPDRQPYQLLQVAIPYGAGIKWAPSPDVHISMELGLRKLFTDYLDDVSSTYADRDLLLNSRGEQTVKYAYRGNELEHANYDYPNEGAIRGNPVNMDSYYFVQLRLSIRIPSVNYEPGNIRHSYSSRRNVRCPF